MGDANNRRFRIQHDGEMSTECFWCGKEIWWSNRFPKDLIYQLTANEIVAEVGGRRYRLPMATIDHYFERSIGGRSEPRNMIPACSACNSSRSNASTQVYVNCIVCGEPRRNFKQRRTCKKCIAKMKALHVKDFLIIDGQVMRRNGNQHPNL